MSQRSKGVRRGTGDVQKRRGIGTAKTRPQLSRKTAKKAVHKKVAKKPKGKRKAATSRPPAEQRAPKPPADWPKQLYDVWREVMAAEIPPGDKAIKLIAAFQEWAGPRIEGAFEQAAEQARPPDWLWPEARGLWCKFLQQCQHDQVTPAFAMHAMLRMWTEYSVLKDPAVWPDEDGGHGMAFVDAAEYLAANGLRRQDIRPGTTPGGTVDAGGDPARSTGHVAGFLPPGTHELWTAFLAECEKDRTDWRLALTGAVWQWTYDDGLETPGGWSDDDGDDRFRAIGLRNACQTIGKGICTTDPTPATPVEDVALRFPAGASSVLDEFRDHCKTDGLAEPLALAGALAWWSVQNKLQQPGTWEGDDGSGRARGLQLLGERLTRLLSGKPDVEDPGDGQDTEETNEAA